MFARCLIKYFIITLMLLFSHPLGAIALTRLTTNDPYPLYSPNDPYDFLTRCRRNELEDYCEGCNNDHMRISTSGFFQTATVGGDLGENQDVVLGNLKGPWNLIGLFYDPRKRNKLIRGLHLDSSRTVTACQTDLAVNLLTEPAGADPNQQFGFLSVPITYRKYGARFEAELGLPCDFTIQISAGLSHIYQEPTFIDLTCTATGQSCPVRNCQIPTEECPSPTSTCCNIVTAVEDIASPDVSTPCINANCCVNVPNCQCKGHILDRVVNQKQRLERLLGLSIDENIFTPAPFSKTGFEDIEIDINWAPMFPINKDRCDWPYFVITPFASLGFTIPSGKKMQHNNLFALPFGNDGHWSYGGRTGITFDFVDAFQIGGDIGYTGFLPRTIHNFPAPTNELQSGVFPELTTMRVQPGLNWHFAAYLYSYRFLDRFSAYAQYMLISHDKDHYQVVALQNTPISSDDAKRVKERHSERHRHHRKRQHHDQGILTRKLRDESAWRTQLVNVSLTYEISPHMQLGIVWQIPIFQQNAYSSSTILASFQVFF